MFFSGLISQMELRTGMGEELVVRPEEDSMEGEEKRMNEDSDLSKWLDNGKFSQKKEYRK